MSEPPYDESSYKDEMQSLKSSKKGRPDEMEKLRSLVMINLAATAVVLLLLIAFLITFVVTNNKDNDNNTCDCECLYEFPEELNKATAAPTIDEDLFNATIMDSQLGNSTVFPWDPDIVIEGRTSVATEEQLRKAVNDAKEARYDPAADVFVEYGYPMGKW